MYNELISSLLKNNPTYNTKCRQRVPVSGGIILVCYPYTSLKFPLNPMDTYYFSIIWEKTD